MRITTSCVQLALVATLVATPSVAQQATTASIPEPTTTGIEGRLAEIAVALQEMREEQRIMRLIRRVELAERRLQPLRNELADARAEVRGRSEEMKHTSGVAESFRQQVQDAIDQGMSPRDAPGRTELEHLERQLATHDEQLEQAERRVRDAEDELALARRTVDRLEAVLQDLEEVLDE